MKIYLFLFCFTSIDLASALTAPKEQQLACLNENGVTNSTDVELFNIIMQDVFKDEFILETSQDKQFSCVFAYIINSIIKRIPQDSIYQELTRVIQTVIISMKNNFYGFFSNGRYIIIDKLKFSYR
uniref:Putative odorant binding protein 33a n=1 Tax=Nasonia vitripennis TaxID=7425 RepID=G8B1N8_NASVI|nr:putative odorant binding protein 33a [Nasonia vitripennis]